MGVLGYWMTLGKGVGDGGGTTTSCGWGAYIT
jgi:hypothetical protein